MLSYKCNISIALWSRAENAPLTINRKTNFLVLLRSWVWWMDSTPLFCLLYPRTRTKRVGNLDCKPINFSAKVRYNHVTETDRAREANGVVQIQRLNVSLSQGCRGQIKRNHTKPFPNAVRGEPRTAFLYISEKEYANESQDHKKGGWIHPDNFVRRLPRGIFGRKGRPSPQSRPQAARQGCLHVLPDTIWVWLLRSAHCP